MGAPLTFSHGGTVRIHALPIAALPGPTVPSSSSSRPRPVSLSPQPKTTTSDEKPRTQKKTNRILGDYTTLGTGSMGKVKLATQNVTGEQVCKFVSVVLG